MCTPCTLPHATHTVNDRNARSVQLTFACVVMTGESRYGSSAFIISADFSGSATPAHWACARSSIRYFNVCVLCGWARPVARACLQRRRERRQERWGDSAGDGGGCRCGSGSGSGSAHAKGVPLGLHRLYGGLPAHSLECCACLRAPAACTCAGWAFWSRRAVARSLRARCRLAVASVCMAAV